jgi:hypothetical protein
MHEDELLALVADLRVATAVRDGCEARLREHPGQDELRALSLAACEAVLAARAAVHRSLVRSGWRPPVQLERRMAQDEVLLGQPQGPAGG